MRLALVVVALCSTAAAAEPATLERARAAIEALDFAGAARLAHAAIAAGGLVGDDVAELFAIIGEAASVAQTGDAGEQAFRAELVLRPDHAPPTRTSPVVTEPFRRARDWARAHGSLHATQTVETAGRGGGWRIRAVVDRDPLGMIARSELWYRDAGNRYGAATLQADAFVVPVRPGVVEYYIAFLDAAGNQLYNIGDAAHPLPLVATPIELPRAPHRPLRTAGIVVVAGGVALLATGTALDVVYARDYGHLETVCGSSCTSGQTARLDVDRGISIAGYAVGAGLVATAAVLFIIDAVQARRPAAASTDASLDAAGPRR